MTHPLNNFVYCKLAPSEISGIGVVAIRDIPNNTELFGGENEYTHDNEDTILPEIKALILDHHSRSEFWDMVPNPNRDVWMQCYMNHSYTPNSDGIFATMDIKKGTEITEDYTKGEPLGEKALKHFTFL